MNIGDISQIHDISKYYVNIRGNIFQIKALANNLTYFKSVEKHCDIMIRADGKVIKNRCGSILEATYFQNFTHSLCHTNKDSLPSLAGTNEEDVLKLIKSLEESYSSYANYANSLLVET